MSRERAPGMALLHPLAPLSLLVLLLNDHWLKHAHPGLVSGKLSDFAAVFLLPLLLHALFELGIARGTGRAPRASLSNAALLICVGVTCIVFALPEVWKPAETAYCFGVAALQWPFRALFALSQGQAPQALRPVAATADVTDLLALPSAYVAWKIARHPTRRASPSSACSARALLGTLLVGAALAHSSVAAAASSQPFKHDGFFMGFGAGPEVLWLHSAASASNGFRQPIPSTTTGFAPGGTLELGGTLPELGLVLGGAIGYAQFEDPVISTLGQRFELRGAQFETLSFQGFVKYFPEPRGNLQLSASLGALTLQTTQPSNRDLSGPCVSLEAGHGVWLGRQWSLGAAARITVADLRGVPGSTLLFMPGAFATIAWH